MGSTQAGEQQVSTELVAVVTAVTGQEPVVLTTDGPGLPAGPLRSEHRSLQAGLRSWVEHRTGHRLGYVEQLYTFADAGRAGHDRRVISVSYLGLTRAAQGGPGWSRWYDYLPWEDHRPGRAGAELVGGTIAPRLRSWAEAPGQPEANRERRRLRAGVTFGFGGRPWQPELALQRYELLYEAGLVAEARSGTTQQDGRWPVSALGTAMTQDHRRILATGLARLRAKIQYRPVVFELLPESFTLGQLQQVVEALAGTALHKQNFRRLVTAQELVESTGDTLAETGGRPARLFRFRREVLDERLAVGTKLPLSRPR